jgi:myo-inositol-1(or 4)-monophosphatase
VSVGLIADGVPVVGVVHAPLLDRTFSAAQGVGAFRDGRPLRVSARPPQQAIVATGFPFRHKEALPRYERAFATALRRFEDLRRPGAASLDLCWTAEGVFDGYFELKLGPWDVAAGGIIVREAGGVVTDWQGNDRAWLRSGNVLAGPPAVHEVLLEIAASTREVP